VKAQFEKEQSDSGEFQRQEDAFREWISNDGSTSYPAAAGRYHLYVSLACPWASRTVIFRKLKGLEDAIGMTIVDPIRDEKGWAFRDPSGKTPLGASFESIDSVNGFHFLSEAYVATDPNFDERVTVPVLWDKRTKKIVNNCVYKAGFATRQRAYEISCSKVFEALDQLEQRLSKSRYLFGRRIVDVDWRLFCTLVRFDVVYHGHFKCNIRRIIDYPNLQGYLMDLYQQPGIAETVNFDHIKRHYYMTHTEINPTRIVPLGPALDLTGPHGREKL